jgi:hypothetical protein
MRAIAIALLVLLVAGTAVANPVTANWLYIDFDPPNMVHEVYPATYSTVEAYLVFGNPEPPDVGVTTFSVMLELTPGMAAGASFTNLLPGGLAIGTWDTGITMASTDCLTEFPLQIGILSFIYLGVPGDVTILDHPDYPNWVVDCQEPGEVFYSCEFWHGGVGKQGEMGECGYVPVEDMSWGAIKSFYR